jgi:hypothetical protein
MFADAKDNEVVIEVPSEMRTASDDVIAIEWED